MAKLNNFFLFEELSSVSKFLKAQYNNIFSDPNQTLNNLFVDFTKKVDTDKNTSNLYQRYIKANQTAIQNEVNNAESIDDVNKLLSDEIKYFYFSLKPVVNKLQDNEFTIQKIFERSRDKRLIALMSYPEDKFANAVSQYTNEIIPEIKKSAGIEENKEVTTNTNNTPTETNGEMPTTERIRYNVLKILEAEDVNVAQQLADYKKSVMNWLNVSLFELIKQKIQILNKIGGPTTSNAIDQLSNQMKATNNENAKKMILNHVVNMDKEQLKKLALSLGITEEELGQL